MYLAEIHGKLSRENENKEDILTSNVFSFFKYANREVFLFQLMKLIGLDVTIEDAQHAEFTFWPTYPDKTEPDLIILIGGYYLLIEAKYHSGFGNETPLIRHQLTREINGGLLEAQNLDKKFMLIVVTGDNYFKREVRASVSEHHQKYLKWVNWQTIAYFIDDLLRNTPEMSLVTKLLAEDLYKLLLKKRLRNYEGVKVLSKIHEIKVCHEAVFFQAKTATYRGDFIGFLSALDINMILKPPPGILFFENKHLLFQILPMSDLSPIDAILFFKRSSRNEQN